MNKKINAVGYARYSTEFQTDNSIAYQTTAIQEYCEKHDINLLKVYSDEAMTGTNTNRPAFQQMLAAAEQHLFDAVIIYDISRGSRNVVDWFSFRQEMARIDIQVISCNQHLGDILDPNTYLTELITAGIGQHMVLDTRKKSIDGKNELAKKGIFCGGNPPLGYDINDGNYIINPKEAKIVQTIFTMYADGHSYNEILKELDGAVGKAGRPLGKNSLYSILKNERYIGVYTWNKRKIKIMGKWAGGRPNPDIVRIENAIPPIIDETIWRKVEERMKDNSRRATSKSCRHNYLLSGLIQCDKCGATFVGHTSTNQKKISTPYYICGNKYRTHTCCTKNINADRLETFVVMQIKHYLKTADFETLADEICKQVNSAAPDVSAEKKELSEIETKITNGINAILGGVNIPELKDEVDKLRIRKSELEDVITYKEKNKTRTLNRDKLVEMLKESAENIDSTDSNTLIRNFVTKIYAHADGTVTVNLGVHINGCGDWT